MRGFPPLQLLLVILGFSLLAIPLYNLTGKKTPSHVDASPQTEVSESQIKAVLRVRCAHAPQKMELLTQKGSLVLWEKENTWPQTVELKMNPDHPLDIAVSATWPEEVTSTAVTLEYIPDGRSSETQTLWSIDSEMEDVFTFNSRTSRP